MTDVITERSILNGEQQPDDGQSLLFCVSLFSIAIRCVIGIYVVYQRLWTTTIIVQCRLPRQTRVKMKSLFIEEWCMTCSYLPLLVTDAFVHGVKMKIWWKTTKKNVAVAKFLMCSLLITEHSPIGSFVKKDGVWYVMFNHLRYKLNKPGKFKTRHLKQNSSILKDRNQLKRKTIIKDPYY